MAENNNNNNNNNEGGKKEQPKNRKFIAQPAVGSTIKHVIGVISGKGGVGKTFVSSYLAVL